MVIEMLHLYYLSFIIFTFSRAEEIHAACAEKSLNSTVEEETKLLRFSVKEISVITPYQCADACLRDTRCKSFNVERKLNSGDKKLCQLNDAKWNEDNDVIQTTGWDYYGLDHEGLQEVSRNIVFYLEQSKSDPYFKTDASQYQCESIQRQAMGQKTGGTDSGIKIQWKRI